jgi:glucokinase-like ROK family protein
MSPIYRPENNQSVKHINKHVIIDMIRFTPGGIARADLARMLGLTRAALTVIINDLEAEGLVREAEAHPAGGRKPIVLEISPGLGHVVGIDMGATHITLILADFSGREIQVLDSSFDIGQGPQTCLALADMHLKALIEKAGLGLHQIDTIGVGVPGPIVTEAGMVSGPPIMPGWDGFPIRDHLMSLWDCPVILSNDADLGALGEWAYGAARGERNVAYVKVGTGIGCGLLINGQIYHGATGSAGEIGHITIDENGPLCQCGNRGCLEALAGGRAIAMKAIEMVKKGQRTQLSEIQPQERINVKDVISAARRGDLFAQMLMSEAGSHLGTAVSSLVNLFNPDMVVIGGGVAQIGDLFIEPIRRTVQQRSLRVASRAVRITVAVLGRRSTSMGAVVLALSYALHKIVEGAEREVIRSAH